MKTNTLHTWMYILDGNLKSIESSGLKTKQNIPKHELHKQEMGP